MDFTLSNLASVAEVIGAAAVIVSLVFVEFQLRETARATRTATASAASASMSAWYMATGCSEQTSALFLDFLQTPEELTSQQRFQAIMNLHAAIISFQNSYYLAKEGTLDSQILNTILESIVVTKDLPGWAIYWKERKPFFFTDFQEYVDSLMSLDRKVSEGIYNRTDSI